MFHEKKTLEEMVGKEMSHVRHLYQHYHKQYLVDYSIYTPFYTIAMGTGEYFIAGLESDEVLKLRVIGAATDLVGSFLYGYSRERWAMLWHTNAQSSRLRKFFVDSSMSIAFAIPYGLALFLVGADRKEASVALVVGTVTGRAYGYLLDKWRKRWGTTPTLDV